MSKEYREDRREFLRSVGRKAIAGLLVFGTGSLIAKKSAKSIEECTRDGICRGCGDLADCGLPQALSYKEHASKNG